MVLEPFALCDTSDGRSTISRQSKCWWRDGIGISPVGGSARAIGISPGIGFSSRANRIGTDDGAGDGNGRATGIIYGRWCWNRLCIAAIQATVDPPSAGKVNVGGVMV